MPKASPLLWINNSWAEPDSAEATPAPSFRTYPLLLELYAPQNQVVGRFLTDELRHVRQESLTIIPPPQHTWHRADESDATQGVKEVHLYSHEQHVQCQNDSRMNWHRTGGADQTARESPASHSPKCFSSCSWFWIELLHLLQSSSTFWFCVLMMLWVKVNREC